MRQKLSGWLCDWAVALWVISITVLFVSPPIIVSMQLIDAASLQEELQQVGRYVYVVVISVGLISLALGAIHQVNQKNAK